uniref:Uncharacterized protein n=2 Tax=Octopus bimaculoides TaxID=37653 RepID=A0A0L8FYM6_OCTBM
MKQLVRPFQNAGSKMCFDDIQQFVSHEISHSKQNTSSLHLSVAVLEELSKVFNPDIKHLLTDNAKSQHKWASRDYRSGHVLRKLFPWTNSLLKNIEIGVEKLLVIDGVTRPWYKMDILEIFDLGPIMYLQSCSEKEVKFYPINSCSNRCSPLPSIKLQASDIVIWQSALWEPEFHPVAGSKELSLAVLAAAN